MNIQIAPSNDREQYLDRIENAGWQYWLVLEGDFGGQIYLTVPWSQVGPNARIHQLLTELDKLAWGSNEGEGAGIDLYSPDAMIAQFKSAGVEQIDPELEQEFRSHISGGMGGGELHDQLWTNGEFDSPAWIAKIREYLDIQTKETT